MSATDERNRGSHPGAAPDPAPPRRITPLKVEPSLSPMALDDVSGGRVFTGRQALGVGLIDAIGDEAPPAAGSPRTAIWPPIPRPWTATGTNHPGPGRPLCWRKAWPTLSLQARLCPPNLDYMLSYNRKIRPRR